MTAKNNNFTFSDGVSLKEYFESRLTDVKELFKISLKSLVDATTLAREAMEKRLDARNEIQQAMKDQSDLFARKADLKPLEKDIQELKETRAELRGKASQNSVIISYIMTFIAIILSVASLVYKR